MCKNCDCQTLELNVVDESQNSVRMCADVMQNPVLKDGGETQSPVLKNGDESQNPACFVQDILKR